MTRVRLSTAAEQDVGLTAAWYDLRQPGVGTHFVQDLHRAIERVRLFPDGFPAVGRVTRRAMLVRFPYAVTYRPQDDGVVVLAVVHVKRHADRTTDPADGN